MESETSASRASSPTSDRVFTQLLTQMQFVPSNPLPTPNPEAPVPAPTPTPNHTPSPMSLSTNSDIAASIDIPTSDAIIESVASTSSDQSSLLPLPPPIMSTQTLEPTNAHLIFPPSTLSAHSSAIPLPPPPMQSCSDATPPTFPPIFDMIAIFFCIIDLTSRAHAHLVTFLNLAHREVCCTSALKYVHQWVYTMLPLQTMEELATKLLIAENPDKLHEYEKLTETLINSEHPEVKMCLTSCRWLLYNFTRTKCELNNLTHVQSLLPHLYKDSPNDPPSAFETLDYLIGKIPAYLPPLETFLKRMAYHIGYDVAMERAPVHRNNHRYSKFKGSGYANERFQVLFSNVENVILTTHEQLDCPYFRRKTPLSADMTRNVVFKTTSLVDLVVPIHLPEEAEDASLEAQQERVNRGEEPPPLEQQD